ncbi:Uncharacterized protein dnm_034950 [Desulfonema magnum]|uniref:Uncharacterized protein n=1 Tax=Desulfonema magnum TaxID=45655 RepID=A0A975GMZ3_9BACT|nr:Uncharacterized protein dnm_034950 [Desulfonema magnum]
MIKFSDPLRKKPCHSCESRNPFLADTALPGASGFRLEKNLSFLRKQESIFS